MFGISSPGVMGKRKGPRTWAPFTSHHPLPPKRSFKEKLIDTLQMARYFLLHPTMNIF